MNRNKLISTVLAGALGLGLLAGCAPAAKPVTTDPGTTTPVVTTPVNAEGFHLNVNFASEPETLDPTLSRTVDGGVMLHHSFEGLLKWMDDGSGKAKLTPGQAESWTKVVNDDATATYTFKLRDGIKWSDGKPVTAGDFVYAWRRLVTFSVASPYNYMIDMVKNANEIMAGVPDLDANGKEQYVDADNKPTTADAEGAVILSKDGDATTLGVTAIDDKTLEVQLVNDCPYFEEIVAFPSTFPVREDIVSANPDQWTFDVATYVGNGPYMVTDWTHNASIKMEKNPNYYDFEKLGPDSITFKLMDDQRAMLTAFNSGDLDYMQVPPVDEIPSLMAEGKLEIADYLGTYYVCFQNAKAPFNNADLRKAFSLAIDRNYIVEKVTQAAELPASGFVPSGVADVPGATEDFRTIGTSYWDTSKEAYEANCAEAKELMKKAGFEGGKGFPAVTYLYNNDNRHSAIAEALQQMWKNVLGVEVQLKNQDWNVFLKTRTAGEYSICRNGWIADYNDPISFLDMWVTGGGNNDAHYSNKEFDKSIALAKSTADQTVRMEAMHKAEQILIGDDNALGPIFFYTQPYMLNSRVGGMYSTPLGFFFFTYATEK